MRFLEHEEQKKVFHWSKIQEKYYPDLKYLNSSQNGVKFTTSKAAIRAKQTGLKRGFPDIFLPLKTPLYSGLFIELKTKENKSLNIKKGKISVEQKDWLSYLCKNGYNAVVCYGADEAISEIRKYLALNEKKKETKE